MPTKAVAKTVPSHVDKAALVKERMMRAVSEMTRPETTAEEMALAILDATTLEGILGSTVLKMEDVTTPFTVLGASLNPSDYVDGLAAYAVLDAVLQDGGRVVIISGATNVVAQLVAMHSGDFFPAWVEFKSATTGSGYTAWKLIKGRGEAPTAQQLAAWAEDF